MSMVDIFLTVFILTVFTLTESDHPEPKNQRWTMRCVENLTIGKNKARLNI
jgi:hypothetical protein